MPVGLGIDTQAVGEAVVVGEEPHDLGQVVDRAVGTACLPQAAHVRLADARRSAGELDGVRAQGDGPFGDTLQRRALPIALDRLDEPWIVDLGTEVVSVGAHSVVAVVRL